MDRLVFPCHSPTLTLTLLLLSRRVVANQTSSLTGSRQLLSHKLSWPALPRSFWSISPAAKLLFQCEAHLLFVQRVALVHLPVRCSARPPSESMTRLQVNGASVFAFFSNRAANVTLALILSSVSLRSCPLISWCRASPRLDLHQVRSRSLAHTIELLHVEFFVSSMACGVVFPALSEPGIPRVRFCLGAGRLTSVQWLSISHAT